MAGPLTAASSFDLQLEAVNDFIPYVGEVDEGITARFKDTGRAKKVSTHSFRVRMEIATPGQYGMGSLESGAFPSGVGSQWDQGLVTPKVAIAPFQFSYLADVATTGTDVASENAVTRSLLDLAKEVKRKRDIMFQQSGNGVIATVDSGYGGAGANPITLAAYSTSPNQAGNGFGAREMSRGQTVQIMSSAFVLRGTCTIQDFVSDLGIPQSITVDQVPAGTVQSDVIMLTGLAQVNPICFSGLPYYNNTSTQGNCMGISRAKSYVVANGMNLNGAPIALPSLRLSGNKVISSLGKAGLSSQKWQTHLSQVQAYEEISMGLQIQPLDGGRAGSFDGLIKDPAGSMSIAGREIIDSLHADQTRWDLIPIDQWSKVVWGMPPYMYKLRGSSDWTFPVIDPASGQITPQQVCYMIDSYDYYMANLKAGVAVTGCAVPYLN